jgi:processing peptidase subunit beta
MESVHYTSFRDHFIGQPVNGIRENLASISHAHIKEFLATNYVSENFVVSAAGNVNHDEVSQLVNKAFSKLQSGSGEKRANLSKPYFTPSTLFMRDDEMANVNVGVFFNAPTYTDPEYFAMHMFQ